MSPIAPSPTPDPAARLAALEARVHQLEAAAVARDHRLCLLVFSGELDKLLAAFNVATGAAASGREVTMFFTFWATAALRRRRASASRPLLEYAFGQMLPMGERELRLSTLNMAGVGAALMRRVMRQKNVPSFDEQLSHARELGVRILVCSTTLELLGIPQSDLIEYPDLAPAGVAGFLQQALASSQTLVF